MVQPSFRLPSSGSIKSVCLACAELSDVDTRRLVLKKTVFLCGRVRGIWVCSTKVDMVCLSPVGYGV